MCLSDVFGDAFHAKNLNVKACAVRKSIVDCTEVLLVNLGHVYAETACCVKPSAASLAFEVLCLLVIDENLQVIEVAFTVIAPWSGEDFFHVGVVALLLRHGGGRREAMMERVWCLAVDETVKINNGMVGEKKTCRNMESKKLISFRSRGSQVPVPRLRDFFTSEARAFRSITPFGHSGKLPGQV